MRSNKLFEVKVLDGGEVQVAWLHCPKCGNPAIEFPEGTRRWVCFARCDWHSSQREVYGYLFLIGSMRFAPIFLELEHQLSLMGYTVEATYVNGLLSKHLKDHPKTYTSEQWDYLLLHMFNKIDHLTPGTDRVVVVNPQGYIGFHTMQEIVYAVITLSRHPDASTEWVWSIASIDWEQILNNLGKIEAAWQRLRVQLNVKQRDNLTVLKRSDWLVKQRDNSTVLKRSDWLNPQQ